jgi:protein phosphatase
LRDGDLLALTEDHTVGNDDARRRERGDAPSVLSGHDPGALTKCVGQGPDFEPDASVVDVRVGDRFLFVTDGLTRHVADAEIAGILANAGDPEAVTSGTVTLALQRGGLDNITVVVVFVETFP